MQKGPQLVRESVGSDEISEHKTRRLRIATWNMDHWKRNVGQRQDAWEYMCAGKLAQVVLLQECVPPAGFKKTRHAYREIGGSRTWALLLCPLMTRLK